MRSSTWFLSDSLVRTPIALVPFKRSSRVLRAGGGAVAFAGAGAGAGAASFAGAGAGAVAFAGAGAGAGFAGAGLDGSRAGAGCGSVAFGSGAALGTGAVAGAVTTFSGAGGGGAGTVGPAQAAANTANPRHGRMAFIPSMIGNMKPKIACSPNGPYRLINDPTPVPVDTLQGAAGERYKSLVGFSLCRCGGSRHKPFFDGTPRTKGFRDPKPPAPATNNPQAT